MSDLGPASGIRLSDALPSQYGLSATPPAARLPQPTLADEAPFERRYSLSQGLDDRAGDRLPGETRDRVGQSLRFGVLRFSVKTVEGSTPVNHRDCTLWSVLTLKFKYERTLTMLAAPANRSDRRRERTRNALITASRGLFGERGVDAVTIQDITDAADVAKGSFYNHFGSKEDVLRATAADVLTRVADRLDRNLAATDSDPAFVVGLSLYRTLRICLDDPTIGRFVLRIADAMTLFEASIGTRARRDLMQGRATGRFAFDDLELVITMLTGGAIALLTRRLAGDLSRAAETDFVALTLRTVGVADSDSRQVAKQIELLEEKR